MNPLMGKGVGFEFAVVRGGGNKCPLAAQMLDHRFRQGGALHRIGAVAELIE